MRNLNPTSANRSGQSLMRVFAALLTLVGAFVIGTFALRGNASALAQLPPLAEDPAGVVDIIQNQTPVVNPLVVGTPFNIQFLISNISGAPQTVNSAALHFNFDPAVLEVASTTDEDGNTVYTYNKNATFATDLAIEFDNVTGQVNFVVGTLSANPPVVPAGNNLRVVTITFIPKACSLSTTFSYVFSGVRDTIIAGPAGQLLRDAVNTSYTIPGAACAGATATTVPATATTVPATATSVPATATSTVVPASATASSTATSTVVPATATASSTATSTVVPATATASSTATSTVVPATATASATATATDVGATSTAVPDPTATGVPATATDVPATATTVPATATDVPATATDVPATATTVPATATDVAATATTVPGTATDVPATATDVAATATVVIATNTFTPEMATNTPDPGTPTATLSGADLTATATAGSGGGSATAIPGTATAVAPSSGTCGLPIPSGSVVGAMPFGAQAFWAPGKLIVPSLLVNPGSYWVIGQDASETYYNILIACAYVWVRKDTMGTYSDGKNWFNNPLPTRVVS